MQKLCNRAWQDIRDAEDWSFLEGFTVIQIPAMVSAGTVSYTQFTNQISCDLTASNALTPFIIPNPAGQLPLVAQQNAAGLPLIGTGYQIRVTAGPLYSIIAASSAPVSNLLTLTVDRIISEPTVTNVAYQSYRAYIGAPSSDFLNWTSITNVAEGYTIRGTKLLGSQAQLNAVDPQRDSTEDMYFLFTLYADANGMPVKEAWPGPVNQQGYIGMYKRRGADLSATVDLPPSMPVNCLLERAKMYAAQWQQTQPRKPDDTTNWELVWKMHERNYQGDPQVLGTGELAAAKKKDTSLRTPAPILRRGPASGFMFSGKFCANHDVRRMLTTFPMFGGSWW